VLSRIAESLFWIGRYVERADGTARIVDAARLQMLEQTGQSEETTARVILQVIMGLHPGDGCVDYATVCQRLVFDAEHASAIAGAWRGARENARRARETVSTELWEAINTAWNRWGGFEPDQVTAAQLAWVRERAALVSGIADSTMSHDQAWLFMALGRSLERADMTARLVATGALPNAGPPWSTVLQSCGAQQAYLRTNRGLIRDDRVASFLVLDRQFPRSVLFSLSAAERRLEAIDPATQRLGIPDEARRRLGRIRTSLEYRPVQDVMADLPAQMRRVQAAVTGASDAVARRYFPSGQVTTWVEEYA
jgi:uncharacterized alpha-E superfamily protein